MSTAECGLRGVDVVFLSWRDTRNPEGGGAERYLEEIAAGLVTRGARVTVFSAAHAAAPAEEERDGIRFVRAGSKLTVYARGAWALARGGLGHPDVVVDVQNGMPFFARLVTRRPVIVLVHHVHREQWPVVYPGLMGRIGWWIESRLAPRVYRGCQYVVVSGATGSELAGLGVTGARVAVVHNGSDPAPLVTSARTPYPSVCVVGRLVPHKRIEHAIDAVAELRRELPALRLTVVGSGWWEANLRAYVDLRGAQDCVTFLGHVDVATRTRVYAESWVLALPSLKEGWGLVVGEAAVVGTPAVAYAEAGGTRESIVDGVTGLLAEDRDGFARALRRVLTEEPLRASLSGAAARDDARHTWEQTRTDFAHVIAEVLAGRRVSGPVPAAPIAVQPVVP